MLLIWLAFFVYALPMAGFCALVGAKTTWRMGSIMASGTILLPLTLCLMVFLPL